VFKQYATHDTSYSIITRVHGQVDHFLHLVLDAVMGWEFALRHDQVTSVAPREKRFKFGG
jgi:predicted metalloprotease